MARSTVLNVAAGATWFSGDSVLPFFSTPTANRGPSRALFRETVLFSAVSQGLAGTRGWPFFVLTFYFIIASVVGHTVNLLAMYLNSEIVLGGGPRNK